MISVEDSLKLDDLKLPDWPLVQVVADVLAQRHIEGLLVGGAVRDMLLGRCPHDWDFVVARRALALARETADRLGAAYYTLDARRETGRVVVPGQAGARTCLDFALCRGEGWQADLAARDFTLNAMALTLNPPGRLLDPLGGQADLAAGLVRAAHPAAFDSDPVRVIRAVRVAATLGFAIEPQTAAWARSAAPLLDKISAERIRDELARLLAMDGLAASLRQLDDLSALEQVVPEVSLMKDTAQSRPHHWNVFEHTLVLIERLEGLLSLDLPGSSEASWKVHWPAPFDVGDSLAQAMEPYRADVKAHLEDVLSDERTALQALKLAALLHDCGKPATLQIEEDGRTRFFGHEQVGSDMASARARALRLSNVEVERVRIVVAHHMRPHHLAGTGLTARAAYRYFRDTGPAGVDIALLALADHLATHGPDVQPESWQKCVEVSAELIGRYFGRLRASFEAPPLLTGRQLIDKLGLLPGPQVGQLLEAIREARAAGEIHTAEQALALARQLRSAAKG